MDQERQRYDDLLGIIETWEYSGDLTREQTERIRNNLDLLVERQLQEVSELLEQSDEPYEALGVFSRLVALLNRGAEILPNIIRRLMYWVKALEDKLIALADRLGAPSYSISVSWTGAVTFSLNWVVPSLWEHT